MVSFNCWSYWSDLINLRDAQRNSPQDCFSRFRQKSELVSIYVLPKSVCFSSVRVRNHIESKTDTSRVSVLLWSWWTDFKNLSDAQRNSPQDCFSRFRQRSKIFFHRYFAETGVLFAGSSSSFKTNKGYRKGILYLLELVAGLEQATCALRNSDGTVQRV